MADPFEAFRDDERPTHEAFAKLDDMVRELVSAEREVADCEEALKRAQERARTIGESDIPEYMRQLGLEEFTTTTGLRVRILTKIRASIGSRKAAAFEWLEKHGHGSLIKRTVQVAFNREQGDEAKQLLRDLEGKFAGVRQDLKVEAATLTSFVKEQLEQGHEIPHDIFGVIEQRFAKIDTK